jgi:hypothetical protein
MQVLRGKHLLIGCMLIQIHFELSLRLVSETDRIEDRIKFQTDPFSLETQSFRSHTRGQWPLIFSSYKGIIS